MQNFLLSIFLSFYLMVPVYAAVESTLRNPLSYSLKEYAFVLLMALAGGMASWWAKVRRGEVGAGSLSALIGELSMSAFAGLMVFYLCEWMQLNPLLTACVVGMSGHAGARALTWLEHIGQRYVEIKLGIPEDKK